MSKFEFNSSPFNSSDSISPTIKIVNEEVGGINLRQMLARFKAGILDFQITKISLDICMSEDWILGDFPSIISYFWNVMRERDPETASRLFPQLLSCTFEDRPAGNTRALFLVLKYDNVELLTINFRKLSPYDVIDPRIFSES
jgi:hypothetical protein